MPRERSSDAPGWRLLATARCFARSVRRSLAKEIFAIFSMSAGRMGVSDALSFAAICPLLLLLLGLFVRPLRCMSCEVLFETAERKF
jgi:hypothetical protein